MYLYLLVIHFILPIQNLISYGQTKMPLQSSTYQDPIISIKLYFNGTNVTVWAKLHSFGYFALLYQNHMSQGDYNIIQIDEQTKKINIRDFHSLNGHSKPVVDDMDDLYVLGYKSNQIDYLQVKYTRFLQTIDQYDKRLILGQNFNFSFTRSTGNLKLTKHGKRQYGFFAGILKNSLNYSIVTPEQKQTYTHDQQNALKHGILLTIFWTVLSDFGILIKHIYFFKYRVFSHISSFTAIIIVTIYQIYKMLSQEDHQEYDTPQNLKIHYKLALSILFWICFQGIIGLANFIVQRKQNLGPNIVLLIRNVHKYSGYILILISKFNLIIGWMICGSKLAQIIILFWNVGIISIYIKYLKKRTTSKLLSLGEKSTHNKLIQDINFQFYEQGNYVIFDDKVYQMNQNFIHPGGKQIIKLIKGRQIDRFIYGMERIQYYQKSSRFVHPLSSIQMLGNPIYIFPRNTRYTLNCSNFNVAQSIKVTEQISLLYLKPKGESIQFEQKCSNVFHLGKYWKLQCFGINRLYTCVTSLRKQNISQINYIFKQLKIKYPLNLQKSEISQQKLINVDSAQQNNQKDQAIPLLIKRYQNGEFTNRLFTDIKSHNIVVQGLKGRGFGLESIPKGQILIVAGGTGLFPFLDLLDILFKLMVNQSEQNIQIQNISAYKEILQKYTFKLFVSVKNIEQLIIMNQLKYMVDKNCHLFQLFIRLTQKYDNFTQNLFGKCLIKQKINLRFIQNFVDTTNLKKILICGPARLYKQVNQLTKECRIPKQCIFYV